MAISDSDFMGSHNPYAFNEASPTSTGINNLNPIKSSNKIDIVGTRFGKWRNYVIFLKFD